MWAQYTYTPGYGQVDITSNCTGTTSCWNATSPTTSPVTGAMGGDLYNDWVYSDGTLHNWAYDKHAWSVATESDSFTKEVAIVDSATIYRLKSSDSYCGTGPTFRTQKWDPQNNVWNNLTTGNDCQLHLAAGADDTLMALGYGNANGAPVGKWNGTSWTAFGSVQLLTISVADANNMFGMGKGTSGVAKIYTLVNGVFTALTNQPPGTAYSCTIGKSSSESGYTMIVTNTAGAGYLYNFSNGTYAQLDGLTISTPAQNGIVSAPPTIVNRSKGTVWAIRSGSGFYHWNNITRYVSMKNSGFWTGCPIQACPGGVTHTTSVGLSLPNGLDGALKSSTQAPSVNINLTSTDESPFCDPFVNGPTGTPCTPVSSGDDFCNFSNVNLGNTPTYIGCYLDGTSNPGFWPFNQNVYVYFSNVLFSSTACLPDDYHTACLVFNGIETWSRKTLRNTTYTFGGVVSLTGQCHFQTHVGDVDYPCGGHFPMIVITGSAIPTESFAGDIVRTPNGYASYILVDPNIQNYSDSNKQWLGAHEEGHHHGLADCTSTNGQCMNLTATDTVMWDIGNDNPLNTPSACDIAWADFWEVYGF